MVSKYENKDMEAVKDKIIREMNKKSLQLYHRVELSLCWRVYYTGVRRLSKIQTQITLKYTICDQQRKYAVTLLQDKIFSTISIGKLSKDAILHKSSDFKLIKY